MATLLWNQFEKVETLRRHEVAMVHADRDVSFGELRRMSHEIAGRLTEAGFRAGDRGLIWSNNTPEAAAAALAIWQLDGITAFVHDEASESHAIHAGQICRPTAVLAQPQSLESAHRLFGCQALSLLGSTGAENSFAKGPFVSALAPAAILFTSGSTGTPKGVTQSHATLLTCCRNVADTLSIGPSDRILVPVPWAFSYGFGQLLTTLTLGVPQILPLTHGAASIREAIAKHAPTIFIGLPAIFALMFRGFSQVKDSDTASIRLVLNAGGKLPAVLFRQIRSSFPRSAISLNYGMTETYRSTALPVELADRYPGSAGIGYPGVSVVVVRADGTQADWGEEGEIVHRGLGTFMGYWGDPEANAKALRADPLWPHPDIEPPKVVYTGDIGAIDKDGLLTITGRGDRIIKSFEVRISLDEVERILLSSGLVNELVAISVPNDLFGEMITVVLRQADVDIDSINKLKSYARQAMPHYLQPRSYQVVDDFPLTPNRKLDLVSLRQRFSKTAAQTDAMKSDA